MRGKGMFLKRTKSVFLYLIITLFPVQSVSLSNEENLEKIFNYLNSLNNFSASFIQDENELVSEGKIYIGNDRVRLDYEYPSKILIILDKDKGM